MVNGDWSYHHTFFKFYLSSRKLFKCFSLPDQFKRLSSTFGNEKGQRNLLGFSLSFVRIGGQGCWERRVSFFFICLLLGWLWLQWFVAEREKGSNTCFQEVGGVVPCVEIGFLSAIFCPFLLGWGCAFCLTFRVAYFDRACCCGEESEDGDVLEACEEGFGDGNAGYGSGNLACSMPQK